MSPEAPEADPTPETKGAQTRRAILQAAIARFGRDGFRSTSVVDIARDASVGGTVAYAYFPNKEALFLAAVDEDAAGVIKKGLATVLDVRSDVRRWHDTLIFTLVEAVERHPLARRLLAGLEPDVTFRVLEIPALNELRKACTELLRTGQAAGTVRADIDPVSVGNGIIALMLAVLMSVTQVGNEAAVAYSHDVAAVFEAALTAPPAPGAVAAGRHSWSGRESVGLIHDPDVNVKLLGVATATLTNTNGATPDGLAPTRSRRIAGSRWGR